MTNDFNSSDISSVQSNDSLVRVTVYNGLRCLQLIIGIIGNGMTLKIIKNLKIRTNGHILMGYLAISDILVNCLVPLSAFTSTSRFLMRGYVYYKTICITKEYFYMITSTFSVISYCILAVDR